ncbi:hypothetical protein CXB51_009378 [Gossypium anomalum]|uniref:Aminotransferase-like plant mobile domain-containing protein n=1 Tax=Gossypium anomalum TaxID=47600 RepID=A0A8J5ZHL2_9ROSI|nr:hypothetical protein CXB51_009378 [Gossypium anomalum]
MFGPSSPLIENYLQEAGFWHVTTIGRGCKLDPKLISALIERWILETHTFHLPCRECTITLEDVHFQLGLPVDGYAVTGSVSSTDWGAVCYELLGVIPDNINGGRIKMGRLRDTFPEPDNDLTELKRIFYARAYILEMIGGYLMPDLSRNLVHMRWLLKLVDFRAVGELSWGFAVLATLYKEMCRATRPNKAKIGGCLLLLQSWARFRFPFLRPRVDHPYTFLLITRWNHLASYVGIPTSLEDIRLLLDQRSKAQFQWTPYKDPTIRVVIPDEFLQNPNVWHVKVPLVNYAIVEMHQLDRSYGRLESIASSSLFFITSSQPLINRLSSHEGSHEAQSGSSSFYKSLSPYGIQTPPPWVMQTPSQSLFYKGGSPSQHPQPDPLPKEPQPPPEADPRRNLARTRRRPPCVTDSDRHGH